MVPFDAVTAFFDPAVQFGLQFETVENQAAAYEAGAAAKDEEPRPAGAGQVRAKSECLRLPRRSPETHGTGGGAEVVRLDRFRKK